MKDLYNLLEQAVEEQESVEVTVGGRSFDVKLIGASRDLGVPPDGMDLTDLTPVPSVGIDANGESYTADEDLQAGDMVSVGLLCKPSFEVEVNADVNNLIKKQPMKYQYGVEYECDGVKPDLPDDVLVDIKYVTGEWSGYPKGISKWNWDIDFSDADISAFRIVDERYKPNLDELSEREPTPELRELMRGSWHERGDFPPVGERCRCNTMDYGWQECDVLSDDNINGFDVMVCRIEPDGCLQYVAAHEFKPLRTEEDELLEQAHIDSENDEWLFSKRELVRRLIRKGWRPPKN